MTNERVEEMILECWQDGIGIKEDGTGPAIDQVASEGVPRWQAMEASRRLVGDPPQVVTIDIEAMIRQPEQALVAMRYGAVANLNIDQTYARVIPPGEAERYGEWSGPCRGKIFTRLSHRSHDGVAEPDPLLIIGTARDSGWDSPVNIRPAEALSLGQYLINWAAEKLGANREPGT